MKRAECVVWWADDSDIPCSCHADPNWPALCEYKEDYEPDDETGFDPYEGCYTYDC